MALKALGISTITQFVTFKNDGHKFYILDHFGGLFILKGVLSMNDFHEAVFTIDVPSGMGQVYKKAIEAENSPNGLRDHWNGNYAYVVIGNKVDRYFDNIFSKDTVDLIIQLLSHTLPNLKETVEWYEKMGAEIIRTNYKENQGKSNNDN